MKVKLVFAVLFILSFMGVISAWEFNGTVRDVNGTVLPNALVNITLWIMGGPTGMIYVGSNSTSSFSNGSFSVTVTGDSNWMYKPVITYTNATTGSIEYIGQSLPQFPYQVFANMNNISFYLREAGTINITAIYANNTARKFQYVIKDTALGYPVAEGFGTYVSEAIIYVPRDRNYSIQIYPNQGMPISYNWNQFNATGDINISTPSNGYNLSNYTFSNHTLKKRFNASESLIWVNGSALNSTGGIDDYDEFTVVPFILEGGNMIYLGDNAGMPYNMSAWRRNATGFQIWTDFYNLTTGFYNITLPGPAESINYILFATARNGTNYYGGYRNISLNYTSGSTSVNFTMYPLMSTNWASSTSNITMKDSGSWQNVNISSARMQFKLVNSSTNATLNSTQAHIEVTVDYTNYNATEFTFMFDVSQTGAASFYLPLINSTGIKEINIYSQSFSPKSLTTRTPAQLIANSNISMSTFNPGKIDGSDIKSSVSVKMYKSNSTCNMPNPDNSCIIADSANMNAFNPLSSIIGGGKLNFVMGLLSSGIIVEYINVDMLASGPPDALFDDSATTTTSGDFDSAMRFGSNGPTIYDYVLISMPYTEGSTSTTGLNENTDVNMSIPVLYDENWNIIWNATNNGTSGTNLAGNQSHYSTYATQWGVLMGANNCTRNQSELNSTKPCYVDTTNNRIWIRLPHFSGTQPSVTGSVITADTATTTTTSTTGGGSSTNFWTGGTFVLNNEQFTKGYSNEIAAKQRLKINISNVYHYVGVISLNATTATINVSSTPQQKILTIGEEWKVDATEDGYYDLFVKLNSINNTKANISIININEKVETPPAGGNQQNATNQDNGLGTTQDSGKAGFVFGIKIWILIVIIAVVLLIIIGYIVYRRKRN